MDLQAGQSSGAGNCGDLAFRHQLHELTEHTPASLHRHSVPALAATQPGAHIRVLNARLALPHPLFNCVMYALDLVGRFEPQLQRLQGLDFRFLADTAFLQAALDSRLLRNEVPPLRAMPGDLVVYCNRGAQGRLRASHVGKFLAPNRVASKWGPGELFVHGLWDLPLPLGSEALYFAMPDGLELLTFVRASLPQTRLLPERERNAGQPHSGAPQLQGQSFGAVTQVMLH